MRSLSTTPLDSDGSWFDSRWPFRSPYLRGYPTAEGVTEDPPYTVGVPSRPCVSTRFSSHTFTQLQRRCAHEATPSHEDQLCTVHTSTPSPDHRYSSRSANSNCYRIRETPPHPPTQAAGRDFQRSRRVKIHSYILYHGGHSEAQHGRARLSCLQNTLKHTGHALIIRIDINSPWATRWRRTRHTSPRQFDGNHNRSDDPVLSVLSPPVAASCASLPEPNASVAGNGRAMNAMQEVLDGRTQRVAKATTVLRSSLALQHRSSQSATWLVTCSR
ncbi:hypothetical protein C8Q76DRAFT_701704 [Earliella scabrosa]|nr:hypothetical protein C8Q76DRAFT_701704 [Earliella scabrosa]